MEYKYAILYNGVVLDYCNTKEQATYWMKMNKVELVEIANASKVEVIYTELSGPNGYGHQDPSFTTYGGILTCIKRLYSWMQNEASIWGPDARDIRDYFRHCRLYINGEDKSTWLFKQADNIDIKAIYV
jgi:hypothetical protein